LARTPITEAMKILFTTKSRYGWGTFLRARNLAYELSKLGHEVTLLCPSEHQNFKAALEIPRPGVQILSLPRLRNQTLPFGMLIRAGIGLGTQRVSSFDVVHTFAPSFPDTWWPVPFAKLRRKPIVIDVDDWWGLDPDNRRPFFEWATQELLETTATLLASRLTGVGDEILNRRTRLSAAAPVEIPNGVDPEIYTRIDRAVERNNLRSKLEIPPPTMLIGLIHDDRFETIVTNLARLIAARKFPAKLIVVGTGANASRRLARVTQECGTLVVSPRLSQAELARVISGVDALLFLMEDIAFDRARFPMKIPEFLATGRPIVASTYGRTFRLLRDAGYANAPSTICVSPEPASFLRAISTVRENYSSYEKIGESAREYVLSELAWSNIVKRLAALYEELIRQVGRR
jgi:glycosyltransferase involved in cell wall biosynthesis